MKQKDEIGNRYDRLLVLSYSGRKRTSSEWLCQCDCGNTVIVVGHKLRSGHTKSCSCLQKEKVLSNRLSHGMSKKPEYRSWQGIKERCYNPNNIEYKNYGARGIIMCDRWLTSFENFLSDMGLKPTKLHTIDRINYNLNYEPDNCRWADKMVQGGNTRRNVWIEYKGVNKIRAEWARTFGVKPHAITYALKNYPPESVFDRFVSVK